ncbi:MAG: CbiX/SirB N-terminal domain-containing protein [Polaromonas sp.]|nr:CbiX/SirB N-terminal domain-containing protein [Polaromonas sp.]
MKPGILLFGHGSRDPLWRLPIEAVASAILTRDPAAQVRCAYLELSAPDLSTAGADLANAGVTAMRVFPLFLGVGKHAREDLPKLVAQLQAEHPGIPVELMPAAGEDARLTALLADIALG